LFLKDLQVGWGSDVSSWCRLVKSVLSYRSSEACILAAVWTHFIYSGLRLPRGSSFMMMGEVQEGNWEHEWPLKAWASNCRFHPHSIA
jgi:hypothetical protein